MTEPESSSGAAAGGESRMGRTYAAVILVEIVVLLALWGFSRYFG